MDQPDLIVRHPQAWLRFEVGADRRFEATMRRLVLGRNDERERTCAQDGCDQDCAERCEVSLSQLANEVLCRFE